MKEGVGPGFVHNGRNEGSTPLVMEVVYINPVGTPLSVEVPRTGELHHPPDDVVTAHRPRVRELAAAGFNVSRERNGGARGG